METPLFIYGTLKRGGVRAPLLAGQTYLGDAATSPLYRLYDTVDYPALVESAPHGIDGLSILGELWAVDQACLSRLDEEEGVDEGLYARRPVVLLDQSSPVQSYFYLHPIDGLQDCGKEWAVQH